MEDAKRRALIRVIGAPILVVLFVLIIHTDYESKSTLGISSLVFLLTIFCLSEFYALCELKGHKPARAIGIICGAISASQFLLNLLYDSFVGMPEMSQGVSKGSQVFAFCYIRISLHGYSFTFLILYLLCNLVISYNKFTIIDAGLTFLGYAYVGLLGGILGVARDFRTGNSEELFIYIIAYIVLMVKSSDIFAYCFGKRFGMRKLAPSISPNKTWEGAIAGFIAGTLFGIGFLYIPIFYGDSISYVIFYPHKEKMLPLIIMSALVTIASQVGDLVESAIKRWAGVKDSGKFLPEFGGFLDLVDGFLLATPVYLICEGIFFRGY